MAAPFPQHRERSQATAYGASRGALETLARYVATPFGKQGIRCNCVAPGLVQTDAVNKAVPDTRKSAAQFLASDKAAFINGAVLLVDGGNLIHESHTTAIHELRNAGLGGQDKGKSRVACGPTHGLARDSARRTHDRPLPAQPGCRYRLGAVVRGPDRSC